MTGYTQPHKQVVGFHVEGASPSPTQPSLLQGEMTAGSPTPVIIPPTFQRESSTRSTAPEAPRTSEPTTSGGGAAGSAAAPATQQLGAAPEVLLAPSVRPAPSTSAPRPITQSEKAEASHAGMTKVSSQASFTTEASMSSGGVFSLDASTVRNTPTQQTPPAAASAPPHAQHHPHAHSHQAHKHHAAPAQGQPSAAAAEAAGAQGPKPQREMTKAERRALQESQRAAKAAQKDGGPGVAERGKGAAAGSRAEHADGAKGSRVGAADPRAGGSKAAAAPAVPRTDSERRPEGSTGGGAAAAAGAAPSAFAAAAQGDAAPKRKKDPKAMSLNSTELFAHLQQYKRITVSSLLQLPAVAGIHPAVLQLGLRYADGSIRGANARCLAMLNAFCQLIRDYTTPDGKELNRDLLRTLNDAVAFLVLCRPLSVGMGNVIRQLKVRITQLPHDMPDMEAKELLEQEIADYINVRIESADTQLVSYAVAKVEARGDTILTYAASHVVQRALIEAARQGKAFRVVVMDSRPELEGRSTLARLLAAGIPCTYVHLNAASYVIRDVTKVFLGAAAVMSNGNVLSRAGTAAVAMMAHAHGKPVMICCETHKFSERVQLDSITHNELGDPQALAGVPGKPEVDALEGWQDNPRLRLLNLKYDVMPSEYVTMVVTEFGMIPPTSVPVILREFSQADDKNVQGQF